MNDRNILARQPAAPIAQDGLSLVEFLIAIALSSLMVVGAVEITLATKGTYTTNDEHSRVQENGRIALDLMTDFMSNAGYDGWANTGNRAVIGQVGGVDATCGADPCTQDEVDPGNGIPSDALAVVAKPVSDTAPVDCTGTAVPADFAVINRFWVADIGGDGIYSLYCQGFVSSDPLGGTETTAWTANGNPQPLVDGIDSLQVQYGVASTGEIERFVSATNLTAAEWDQGADTSSPASRISAVRVGLLVSNGQLSGSLDPMARSFELLDSPQVDIAVGDPGDDQLRNIYTTTVSFTNSLARNW